MTCFLLDTDTASRVMRAERPTVSRMRRAGATDISISAVSQSELLFGAQIDTAPANEMSRVRRFLLRVAVREWDWHAAEHHAQIRAASRRAGRSAGVYDIMIAAHARALGAILVTSDQAIANLRIPGLMLDNWA